MATQKMVLPDGDHVTIDGTFEHFRVAMMANGHLRLVAWGAHGPAGAGEGRSCKSCRMRAE
jgi:hypothetical protein